MRRRNKLLIGIGIVMLVVAIYFLLFSPAFTKAAGYTYSIVQQKEYDKTFTNPSLAGMDFKDCDQMSDEELFNRGQCSRVYFCVAVVPNTATSLKDAVWKECQRLNSPADFKSIRVKFVPAQGIKYAVTSFIFKETHYAVYNEDGTFSGTYTEVDTIPSEYKNVEETIGVCKEGYMLRGHTCLPAQGICLNQFGSNMCTNEYEMWCLSYEDDANGNPIFDCANHPGNACVDRDYDGTCDTVVDVTCSDMNNNGICDNDEALLHNSCVDENHNGICDDVETEGCFCTANYDPVCADGVTYPNDCFAACAGKTYFSPGECQPIEIVRQCEVDSDCPSVPGCLHIEATCVNYQCSYVGECEQCQEDSDCPASPCIGVAAQCGANGMCQYSGSCITTPKETGVWAKILAMWSAFWAWILSSLQWI